MLLFAHLIVGAVLGLKIQSIWLIILLSIFLHFAMDVIPHSHYTVENLQKKVNNKSGGDFAKVLADMFLGLVVCFFLIWHSANLWQALLGMLFSILPDSLTFIYWQTKTPLLEWLYNFHVAIHRKKEPPFLKGLTGQILTVIIAIIIFF
jgi:hypothetical protein